MMENPDILDCPLTAIGRQVRGKTAVTIYMHQGFDRPLLPIDHLCAKAIKHLPADGSLHLVWGSHANPYFDWPVYAQVEAE